MLASQRDQHLPALHRTDCRQDKGIETAAASPRHQAAWPTRPISLTVHLLEWRLCGLP